MDLIINFEHILIQWFEKNQRQMPWRDIDDPYKIWLSEIMLQQTRVQQAINYYHRFIELWPTVHDLANASQEQVLKAWQGLGYYSRARNLHQTARVIVYNFNGTFPNNFNELKKLKGIGEYTARAIAAFAFNQKYVALDGNALRVISRIFDIDLPINSEKHRIYFQQLADSLLITQNPKEFNYALMDLGSTICKPTNPTCQECPFHLHCLAFINKSIHLRPQKIKNKPSKNIYLLYFFYQIKHKIPVLKVNSGFWKELYVLPYKETSIHEWNETQNHIIFRTEHILTHRNLFIKILGYFPEELRNHDYEWLTPEQMTQKPFPKPFHDFWVQMNIF